MSLLSLDAVRVDRGARAVVEGMTFDASGGELLALMGPSGCGKTTLLRAIAGLEPLADGTIVVDGVTRHAGAPASGRAARELQRKVGMVFQFHHLFAHLSAIHNVWLAPVHVLRHSRSEAEERARDLLDMLGVLPRADALPHELSGGEAQRVAIARALAVDPPVLLMDEPTASLDPDRRMDLAATLRGLTSTGRAIVVATHDLDFARACASRVIRLEAPTP